MAFSPDRAGILASRRRLERHYTNSVSGTLYACSNQHALSFMAAVAARVADRDRPLHRHVSTRVYRDRGFIGCTTRWSTDHSGELFRRPGGWADNPGHLVRP